MARIIAILLAFAPLAALAAGDPEAGEQKAAVCAACHGADGNSAVAVWPKIAGQHPGYLARQTRMVRDQTREVPQMYGMVMNLSDEDIDDLAAYYAQQTIEPGVADEALVELGRTVYHDGNRDSGVPACAACHGPAGNGIPGANYPMLRAQHADYTADRLNRYRAGEVNGGGDPYSRIMAGVAANLSDEEIEAVSSYIEGLHQARWEQAAGN
ncbi:MAG: c-type cytochrome [Gammaproteobacteria bacterium]|jgi:cytochrome c553|nr:c-type cytochrome [Gammaproteobacteria bacterium]